MQSVSAAFTVEERDATRSISQAVQVAWKKDYRPGIRFFTIGVSTIGGPDVIKSDGGVVSDWNNYLYEDESARVLSIDYERALNMPVGGLTKALADVELDNTSGRYTPRYAGGTSPLFTAVPKPRRPVIINAGFHYNGIDNNIPQFVGVTTKAPKIDYRSKRVTLQAADFIDFIQNRYVDHDTMFTGQRSDQVIEAILQNLGFATAQYELDTGINIIDFGQYRVGDRFGDVINKIVQAEYGHFYQDEEGRLRFENRQHWDSSPHTSIQRIITTAQVITAQTPSDQHIINVVEVKSQVRRKQPEQVVFRSGQVNPIAVATGRTEVFINFEDPVMAITTPTGSGAGSFFRANSLADDSGTEITSNLSVTKVTKFSTSAILEFTNSGQSGFITELVITGRPATLVKNIYYRDQDDSSVTAYEEQSYAIENDYIQNDDWAKSLSRMVLNDFSEPENLQVIKVRAVPELQLGDLISWQGRYWRIFGVRTTVDPAEGFVQELTLLQRTITSYFRIGISTIGGSDKIAP